MCIVDSKVSTPWDLCHHSWCIPHSLSLLERTVLLLKWWNTGEHWRVVKSSGMSRMHYLESALGMGFFFFQDPALTSIAKLNLISF